MQGSNRNGWVSRFVTCGTVRATVDNVDEHTWRTDVLIAINASIWSAFMGILFYDLLSYLAELSV